MNSVLVLHLLNVFLDEISYFLFLFTFSLGQHPDKIDLAVYSNDDFVDSYEDYKQNKCERDPKFGAFVFDVEKEREKYMIEQKAELLNDDVYFYFPAE